MKRYLQTFLFYIIFVFSADAQSVSISTIGTSGDFYNSAEGSIAFTIGEPISETYTTSNQVATMGFHQTQLVVASIDDERFKNVKISVYPIPANDDLHIQIDGMLEGKKVTFQLFDAIGKAVTTKSELVATSNILTSIDVKNLAGGYYFLSIEVPGFFTKYIRISKTI
jgi:hypothetical protein